MIGPRTRNPRFTMSVTPTVLTEPQKTHSRTRVLRRVDEILTEMTPGEEVTITVRAHPPEWGFYLPIVNQKSLNRGTQ